MLRHGGWPDAGHPETALPELQKEIGELFQRYQRERRLRPEDELEAARRRAELSRNLADLTARLDPSQRETEQKHLSRGA